MSFAEEFQISTTLCIEVSPESLALILDCTPKTNNSNHWASLVITHLVVNGNEQLMGGGGSNNLLIFHNDWVQHASVEENAEAFTILCNQKCQIDD